MDSLLPCTRIGQTMLSFEGSLPKVGRTTLAQEESLFNICARFYFTILIPRFQGKSGSHEQRRMRADGHVQSA